jgi:hypothetical protein
MFAGVLKNFFLVEQQSFAGFDCEHGNIPSHARVDGAMSDTRNVESEILLRFAHLDDDSPSRLPSKETTPANTLVGALEALDGEHRAFSDDDGLTDVEAADGFGDVKAEFNVALLFFSRFLPGEKTGLWDGIAKKLARIEQLHAVLAHLIGNRAENRFGIPRAQTSGDTHHAKIKPEIFEQICRTDAARHHGSGDFARSEYIDELAELANFHPFDFVNNIGNGRLRLVLECRCDKVLDAVLSRGAGKQQRQIAIASNDAE